MWRDALWFWPLIFVIPAAVAVVIRANRSVAWQGRVLRILALSVFSYAFYYFTLCWPVWLMELSGVKRLVISALVPVGVLLLLAVLPLNRPMDPFAIQPPILSFMFWFVPGELINRKLDSAVWASPCKIPMWEARQKALYPYIHEHTFLPDGRILIHGGISKPGRHLSGVKLTRLLPDGSPDPDFKGHSRCLSVAGQLLPQPDGRILLGRGGLDTSPYGPTTLALIVSPEGEEERRVSIPQLSREQLVWGEAVEFQMEPDGGFVAYGNFTGKNTKFQSFRLRISAEGQPDLSSSWKVPGLESHRVKALTRDADGRFFISYDNPVHGRLAFLVLTADGQPDEAFQARLLETQRENGLEYGRALALQADGKIVTVFEKRAVKHEVVRLNRDGTLDTSFQRTPLPFRANHVSVFADGSILVAREIRNMGESSSPEFVEMARMGPEGGIDEAVTQRIREACRSQKVAGIFGLAVKPDGTVLLYRPVSRPSADEQLRLLVQLRPDGSLDTGFQPPF